MNVKSAFTYAFRKENWQNVLLIPSLFLIGMTAINLAYRFIVVFPTVFQTVLEHPHMSPYARARLNYQTQTSPQMLLMDLFLLILMLPVQGYFWELVHTWQTHGMEAPAPRWKGRLTEYAVYGIQLILCGFVNIIPLILTGLTLGLVAPWTMAPYFLAAKEKTVMSFIKQYPRAVSVGLSRYLPVLGTFYLLVLIGVIAIIPGILLVLTIVGFFVFVYVLKIASLHLMTQAYAIHTSDDEASSI